MLPIALLLFRDSDVDEERRRAVLATLEDFLVRRMICGWTTKNYNRLAADLVGAIKSNSPTPDTAVEDFLVRQDAPANKWPTDSEVRDVLQGKSLYGFWRQDRLVMILWEIEKRLRAQDSRTEQDLTRPKDLTLEHVLPQTWEEHWPLDESAEDPRVRREEHLHRLGNLTLTTGELNSSLSNSPWSVPEAANDKRRALVRHSVLRLNSNLVEENPDGFDETAIDLRGERLAGEVLAIWPGPATVVSPSQHPPPAQGALAEVEQLD